MTTRFLVQFNIWPINNQFRSTSPDNNFYPILMNFYHQSKSTEKVYKVYTNLRLFINPRIATDLAIKVAKLTSRVSLLVQTN